MRGNISILLASVGMISGRFELHLNLGQYCRSQWVIHDTIWLSGNDESEW